MLSEKLLRPLIESFTLSAPDVQHAARSSRTAGPTRSSTTPPRGLRRAQGPSAFCRRNMGVFKPSCAGPATIRIARICSGDGGSDDPS